MTTTIKIDPFCKLGWHDWCGGTWGGWRKGYECPHHTSGGEPALVGARPKRPTSGQHRAQTTEVENVPAPVC